MCFIEGVWQQIRSFNHSYFFSFTALKTWLQTMSKWPFDNMSAITIWWIWRFRNNHTLDDKQWKSINVLHFIDIKCTNLTSVNIHSSKHHTNCHIVISGLHLKMDALSWILLEVVVLSVTLFLPVYFMTTREIGQQASLLIRGREMRFLLSYLGFTMVWCW
jgi:hypothetical protein